MCVKAENLTSASGHFDAEANSVNNERISLQPIEERSRANLEPLLEEILNLTQLLNQLIHQNSLPNYLNGRFLCSSPTEVAFAWQRNRILKNFARNPHIFLAFSVHQNSNTNYENGIFLKYL